MLLWSPHVLAAGVMAVGAGYPGARRHDGAVNMSYKFTWHVGTAAGVMLLWSPHVLAAGVMAVGAATLARAGMMAL
jgi:hypothetical protein